MSAKLRQLRCTNHVCFIVRDGNNCTEGATTSSYFPVASVYLKPVGVLLPTRPRTKQDPLRLASRNCRSCCGNEKGVFGRPFLCAPTGLRPVCACRADDNNSHPRAYTGEVRWTCTRFCNSRRDKPFGTYDPLVRGLLEGLQSTRLQQRCSSASSAFFSPSFPPCGKRLSLFRSRRFGAAAKLRQSSK